MDNTFDDVATDGTPHHLLARFLGQWTGTAVTSFEPGIVADTSPIEGVFRSILDGRFVVHEYVGTLQGTPMNGMAVIGYDKQDEMWNIAWVDSVHNGTALMLSVGARGDDPDAFSVLGSYGPREERWGWRTEYRVVTADKLSITHYNITPSGEEAEGVAITFERRR